MGFSIYANDPFNFTNWIQNNEEKWKLKFPRLEMKEQEKILPRALAGMYLSD